MLLEALKQAGFLARGTVVGTRPWVLAEFPAELTSVSGVSEDDVLGNASHQLSSQLPKASQICQVTRFLVDTGIAMPIH